MDLTWQKREERESKKWRPKKWRVGESSSSASTAGQPLLSVNQVSFLCKSLSKSIRFYEQMLGFVLIQRPASLDSQGAWLFNYGIGIHLLESERASESGGVINPKDNHISFQCSNMKLVMQKLENHGIDYVTAVVDDGGIQVDQLFFHDPDGYMVEICNCQNLPVLPLSSCPLKPPISNSKATLYLSPRLLWYPTIHTQIKCRETVHVSW